MESCCSRAMVALRAGTTMLVGSTRSTTIFPSLLIKNREKRNYSIKSSTLDPPDVGRLAETARIALTPQEVQEFGPKIEQVVEWFGQLQAVDLESIEPAIRSDIVGENLREDVPQTFDNRDIDGENLREDVPQTFDNRDAIITAVPSYEEPYIKVPKVLNKE